MSDDFLSDISQKEEVKKAGISPFAKKKSSSQRVVRISGSIYEKVRVTAFEKHSTIAKELNDLIEDGYKYRKINDDKD